MNKLIERLAEQANLLEYAREGLGGGGYISNEKEITKFAKLIIKECETVLRQEGELGKVQLIAGPSGMYKLSFMNMAANIIKDHFGISPK
jgi:hypothetical protein